MTTSETVKVYFKIHVAASSALFNNKASVPQTYKMNAVFVLSFILSVHGSSCHTLTFLGTVDITQILSE